MQNLSLIDWSVCLGYLIFVFALGLWFSREQQTNDDYFVGGKTMHWLPIGLSLFAGLFSALSFVGLPAEAAYKDYHLYLAILFIPLVVVPIVWIWFLPLYFRLGAISCHEYIEQRFNRPLRLTASILFMLYIIGWMGNMLRSVGVIMQAVLEINDMQTAMLLVGVGLFATSCTTVGGVKAVVWTDALQAFALGLVTITMALIFYFVGGQVFPLIMKIAGMFLGLLLGLFLLGLLVPRANSRSATLGMIGGGLGLFAAIALEISHWWYGAFACLPVFLIGVVASLRNTRQQITLISKQTR